LNLFVSSLLLLLLLLFFKGIVFVPVPLVSQDIGQKPYSFLNHF